jgi:hypothetical protein
MRMVNPRKYKYAFPNGRLTILFDERKMDFGSPDEKILTIAFKEDRTGVRYSTTRSQQEIYDANNSVYFSTDIISLISTEPTVSVRLKSAIEKTIVVRWKCGHKDTYVTIELPQLTDLGSSAERKLLANSLMTTEQKMLATLERIEKLSNASIAASKSCEFCIIMFGAVWILFKLISLIF